MSLVDRLRACNHSEEIAGIRDLENLCYEAADRIEELERALAFCEKIIPAKNHRLDELEGALRAIIVVAGDGHPNEAAAFARAALNRAS